jgi:hypothetical protein
VAREQGDLGAILAADGREWYEATPGHLTLRNGSYIARFPVARMPSCTTLAKDQ